MSIEIKVPDLGGAEDVEVIELLVNVGDSVDSDEPLITVESDKASMDIPSPQAGTVSEIKVAIGDRISEGDLIALLEASEQGKETHKDQETAVETDQAEAQAIEQPSPTDASNIPADIKSLRVYY